MTSRETRQRIESLEEFSRDAAAEISALRFLCEFLLAMATRDLPDKAFDQIMAALLLAPPLLDPQRTAFAQAEADADVAVRGQEALKSMIAGVKQRRADAAQPEKP